MIKKLILLLFICTFLTYCGKKGDPVFNKKNSKLHTPEIMMIS